MDFKTYLQRFFIKKKIIFFENMVSPSEIIFTKT